MAFEKFSKTLTDDRKVLKPWGAAFPPSWGCSVAEVLAQDSMRVASEWQLQGQPLGLPLGLPQCE